MSATTTAPPRVTQRLAAQARKIEKRREELGMTRTALATKAGCSPAMLANLEHGRVPTRSAMLPKILETLEKVESKPARKPASARRSPTRTHR